MLKRDLLVLIQNLVGYDVRLCVRVHYRRYFGTIVVLINTVTLNRERQKIPYICQNLYFIYIRL